MGQTLSSPDTEKHSQSGQDERFLYSVTEMQGWRISMEDAHAIELNLDEKEGEHNSFFAVYDGHGGGTVAKFAGENVHKRLLKEESYAERQWDAALKRAFLGTDEDIRAGKRWDPSGCTAVAALVTEDGRIFVANAGDSRAVMSVKGTVEPLSFDHKPLNDGEMKRIRAAGGYVEYGRVNGNLALSRAIGDFEFKKNATLAPEEQIITSNPDITEHKITEEDEFIVLACDGIWDCLQSQQVVDIVRRQVAERKELTEISEFICELCLAPDTSSGAGVGCDNMTVLIIAILNGRTKEQWYDWMEDRVKRKYGYDTPEKIPQLYSPSRVNAFRARRQAMQERSARERLSAENDSNDSGSDNNADNGFTGVFGGRGLGPSGGLGGFARSMLGTGITFHPSTGISADDGTVMFSNDDSEEDSDEDDSDDAMTDVKPGEGSLFDENSAEHQFLASLGLRPPVSDVTKSLKAQLDELEDSSDEDSGARIEEIDDSHDTTTPRQELEDDDNEHMSNPGDEAQQAFGAQTNLTNGISTKASGEAPPPPAPLVNGDIKVKQLNSLPGGDEAPPVVKAEGLMDGSESPLKG